MGRQRQQGRGKVAEQLTEERRAATPSLVGWCRACNGIVACIVVCPETDGDRSREVGKWVRSGLKVGEIPVSEVRSGRWCDCKRTLKKSTTNTQTQLDLAEAPRE